MGNMINQTMFEYYYEIIMHKLSDNILNCYLILIFNELTIILTSMVSIKYRKIRIGKPE